MSWIWVKRSGTCCANWRTSLLWYQMFDSWSQSSNTKLFLVTIPWTFSVFLQRCRGCWFYWFPTPVMTGEVNVRSIKSGSLFDERTNSTEQNIMLHSTHELNVSSRNIEIAQPTHLLNLNALWWISPTLSVHKFVAPKPINFNSLAEYSSSLSCPLRNAVPSTFLIYFSCQIPQKHLGVHVNPWLIPYMFLHQWLNGHRTCR